MSNKKRRAKNRLMARQKMRAKGTKPLRLKWTEFPCTLCRSAGPTHFRWCNTNLPTTLR